MNFRYSLFGLSALLAAGTHAEQRSEREALQLARQYVEALRPQQEMRLTAVASEALVRAAAKGRNGIKPALTHPYYVFNQDRGGFVVVSGSTHLPPVLAYGENGTISADAAQMPDGLRYWLGYVEEASAYVEQHPEAAARPLPDFNQDVAPMLENSPIGNILFNQNSPYNDLCPTGCFTGCMATAMAQVLAYHQYPSQPRGTVTLSNNKPYHNTVNLDQEHYDWSKILPTYKGGLGTAGERLEVAKLHYHVGVALNMEYGASESGSVSTMYVSALKDHFCYNENVVLLNRDNYTYGEWMSILLNEFEHNRPVIYDGVSASGGHAFVLDGYRANDGFVHCNWGWEGTSNGWYNICLLDPSTTGTGALYGGFTSYQDMVINIEPDVNAETVYYLPLASYGGVGYITSTSNGKTIALGGMANIGMEYIANMLNRPFNGSFSALIEDAEGQVVAECYAGEVQGAAATMNSNYHVTTTGGNWMIPTSLEDGLYRVYIYIKEYGRSEGAILHCNTDNPNFVDMAVANGHATFSLRNHHPTALKASDWNFETAPLKHGDTGLKCLITNTGDLLEYGNLRIQVDIPGSLTKSFYMEHLRFEPGEVKPITIPLTFSEFGEYTIHNFNLLLHNGGGMADIVEPMSVKFSVNRSQEECVQQLTARLNEVQAILNRSKLSGNYPEAACDKLQGVIDAIRAQELSTLSVEELNALLAQLNSALIEFYQSMQSSEAETTYWSYVGNTTPDTGWCPSVANTPGWFAISIPEEELAPYVGGQIVGLNALIGRRLSYQPLYRGDIRAKVFLLEYDGVYPGSRILAESDEFDPTYYDYHDYKFKEPYTIGATGVLCVVQVSTQYAPVYAAMAACKSVTMPGACWMNNGNGWEDMYYSYGSYASGNAIKAIIVGGVSVIDAKLNDVTAKSVAVDENIVVNASVQNLSSVAIEEFDVNWSFDDGQSGTLHYDRHIEVSESARLEMILPAFSNAKLHNVHLDIAKVNGQEDAIPENSIIDLAVPVTAHRYVRRVVCEENTGTNCGYCPRGIVTFEYMKEKYGSEFIPVSIHHYSEKDPMYYYGGNYVPLFVYLNTAPSGMIDRSEQCYTTMDRSEVEELFLKEQSTCIAQISHEARYDETTGKVEVKSTTEFGYDYEGGHYRISYLVLEDRVGPYQQTNYYSYAYNYGMGAMGGWESKGISVSMMYDDVLREQFPAYTGLEGSVPAQGVGGESYDYTYSFGLPANVKNPDNVRIVCLLLDVNTREIINASEAPLLKGSDQGLDAIESDRSVVVAYDLQGHRVAQPQHGLYIVNGMKMLVK